MSRKLYIFVLLLAGIPHPACMDVDIPLQCIDSLDCPAGYKCNQDTKLCEPFDKPRSVVDLELAPPSGTSCSATQIADIDLASSEIDSQQLDLELANAILLEGHVGSPVGVTGALVAKRDPAFDARHLTWNIAVDTAGYFEQALTAGDYELLFRPSNREDFPQLRMTGLTLLESQEPDLVELAYPSYPQPESIQDQETILLVQLKILESENAPHPVAGIQVEGTTDKGLRSNLVSPDAQGVAYLRLPVEIDERRDKIIAPLTLALTIKPANAGAPYPTIQTDAIELAGFDLGTFYVGEMPESHAVSGVVTDAGGRTVAGCQLRFEGPLGNGTFRQTIESQASGFTTTLPAGTYSLTAVPPLEGEAGMLTTEQFEVYSDRSGVPVVLPDRPRLCGTALDSQGNTVADVIVQAERLGSWTGVDDGIQRTHETSSGSNGHFEMAVDPGRYHFTMIPPATSGLPMRPAQALYVFEDDALGEDVTTLPEPAVVKGHVYSRNGTPQCGVSVDVYRSDEDSAYLIGQTFSEPGTDGCSGAYAAIIPAVVDEPVPLR
ncbi:MAG: carboxypeptidase regulatory-like domain-containing protein [Deltaproteobacteria bacterium]|nr:carboxypeptidase regulatory-like domain-containing protein [Deltaproteobacteria bacterium]